MKVQVRFLGIFRDLAGHAVGEYQLPEHGTVRDLVDVIGTRHERLGQMRGQYRVMVNAVQSTADQELHAGDEIVVLGPISGGNDVTRCTTAHHRPTPCPCHLELAARQTRGLEPSTPQNVS